MPLSMQVTSTLSKVSTSLPVGSSEPHTEPAVSRKVMFTGAAGLLLVVPTSHLAQTPGTSQPAPPATPAAAATLRGRVVRGDSGLGLAGARVSVLSRASAIPLTQMTDEQGRFELTGLAPGTHQVSASKTGFVALSYGQRGPSDTLRTIELNAGERRDGIDIVLPVAGALEGRFVSETNEPLAGAISADATARIWETDTAALLGLADSRLTRAPSDGDRIRFGDLLPESSAR